MFLTILLNLNRRYIEGLSFSNYTNTSAVHLWMMKHSPVRSVDKTLLFLSQYIHESQRTSDYSMRTEVF